MGAAATLGARYDVRGAIYVSVAVALTLVVSELTFRFIEKPLRDLRHKKMEDRPQTPLATLPMAPGS